MIKELERFQKMLAEICVYYNDRDNPKRMECKRGSEECPLFHDNCSLDTGNIGYIYKTVQEWYKKHEAVNDKCQGSCKNCIYYLESFDDERGKVISEHCCKMEER